MKFTVNPLTTVPIRQQLRWGLLCVLLAHCLLHLPAAHAEDEARYWSWVHGSKTASNLPNHYGTQGVESKENTPLPRSIAASWTDLDGNYWVFGGSTRYGWPNDLWRYNPASRQWTWMKGSDETYQVAVYGTQGVADDANTPGALVNASSWLGSEGKLWLFGGYGTTVSGEPSSPEYFDNLWCYDPLTNQWAWVKGTGTGNSSAVYGTQGVPALENTPGGVSSAAAWTGDDGQLWLLNRSILWRYDPASNMWTWVKGSQYNAAGYYGIQGIADDANLPPSRSEATTWTDTAGSLWLFGGYGGTSLNHYSDLWRYNPTTNQWTWMNGSDELNQPGVYNVQGVFDENNLPAARSQAMSWVDATGRFWLYGGATNQGYYSRETLDDLWCYDPAINQWMWATGSKLPNQLRIYSAQGTEAPENTPGSREAAMAWGGGDNTLWLYGGYCMFPPKLTNEYNDIWRFNIETGQWTWIDGSVEPDDMGYSGEQGVADGLNVPSPRRNASTWTGIDGKLWLFGGIGWEAAWDTGCTNDLWRFDPDTNQWTWVKGSTAFNQEGNYGTQGIANDTNVPSARMESSSWVDDEGNLWLFGGEEDFGLLEELSMNNYTRLNDMWKYNPTTNQWTWMKGSSTIDPSNVYIRVDHEENTPGSRVDAVHWKGNDGTFWIYSGSGYTESSYTYIIDELWQYNPATNLWNKITPLPNESQERDTPGGNHDGLSWADSTGRLWLYSNGEIWHYDPAANQWTLVKESSETGPVYGELGIADPANTPGGRSRSVTWVSSSDKFWLMSNQYYNYDTRVGYFINDLWQFDPETTMWTWMEGSQVPNQPGVYGAQGLGNVDYYPGAHIVAGTWIDADDNFWMFGGSGIDAEGNAGFMNDLWTLQPLPPKPNGAQWGWVQYQ